MAPLIPRAPIPVFRPTTPMPSTLSASKTVGSPYGTSFSRSGLGVRTTPVPPSTCSTCFRTHRATSTWATPRRMPWAMSSRAIGSSAATTSCTPLVGTRSDYPQRTLPSSALRIRWRGPTPTSISRSRQCDDMRARSTGTASSTPATRSTTTGTSGSSLRCSIAASPTDAQAPSTGVPIARPCWPTSRSSAGCASDATPRSPRRS